MKFTIISDTHGYHDRVTVPPGDVLIHCGDFCSTGNRTDAEQFLAWFSALPHRHKVLISGNHDLVMERSPRTVRMPDNVCYLQDSGCEIDGVKFWGSPVQPQFLDWAFNRNRGSDIKRHWDKIPAGIDVLITHGPPAGILDMTGEVNDFITGELITVGCEDLAAAVARVRPNLHCFGHIHSGYGRKEADGTRYFNAAICDEGYKPVNLAWTVEL